MTKEQTHCQYVIEHFDELKIILSKDDSLSHMLHDFIVKRREFITKPTNKD